MDLLDLATSTYVYGIRPPDERWRRMKRVWDVCHESGISPPPEVIAFFNDEEPDGAGVVVSLDDSAAVRLWKPDQADSMREGLEVDLSLLPDGVKTIRVVHSY